MASSGENVGLPQAVHFGDGELVPGMHLVDGVPMSTELHPLEHLNMIKSWSLHPNDVMVAGYPKSGNVWLVTTLNAILRADDLDGFEKEGPAGPRRPIEDVLIWNQNRDLPHPAVQMSHMRYWMLPSDVKRKGIKVVHISRNPKDVCVSAFHYIKMFKAVGSMKPMDIPWDTFVEMFTKMNIFGTWADYMKDWLKYRDDPNILFIQYEDFVSDPQNMIRRLSEHINKQLSPDQIERIVNLVSFSSMKENPKLDVKHSEILDNTKGRFVRKGKVGDWKNYFTKEQSEMYDQMYEKLASETGFHINFE